MSAEERLSEWRRLGSLVEVRERRLFVVESASRASVDLVLLHGFPTCSYEMHRVLPLLSSLRRVIVHDHPGFGLSDKAPERSYSLLEQARVAAGLWDRLGVRRCHLVAHDYGTSVATELLALREEGRLEVEIESVVLSNGSIYLDLARLMPIQRLLCHPLTGRLIARLARRSVFERRMRRLWGNAAPQQADLDTLWHALTRDGGRAVLPKLARYLDERRRYRRRWIDPLRRLDRPALVLWGRRDPVAVAAIAERLVETIPAAELCWLDQAGHYPMLEDPEGWAGEVLRFVDAVERQSREPNCR